MKQKKNTTKRKKKTTKKLPSGLMERSCWNCKDGDKEIKTKCRKCIMSGWRTLSKWTQAGKTTIKKRERRWKKTEKKCTKINLNK